MSETERVLFRVDPRLVHATLTNAWVPAHQAGQLIVADGVVAADDRRRHIVEIAAIDVGRVLFTSEEDVGAIVEDIDQNTIVLFSTLDAVERALGTGLRMSVLNVGHVPEGAGRDRVTPAIFLGPDERASIDRIQANGVQVRLQSLPDDEPVLIDAPTSDEASSEGTDVDDYAEAELEIVNERGLHLRAAHVLAGLCNRFANEIEVGRDDLMVNAKSLLGLTALGAAAGTRLKVVVKGPGARDALAQLRDLFAGGFNEGVAPGRKGAE